ncbi:GntR family transcriptional regulator [Agrobacterium sp. rho-8.1]|nr:GntR family transcriptional regulator [Agrobacterium sp. rho-8.1]
MNDTDDVEANISGSIRTAILQGRLPPGVKLTEDLVAEALDVSRARVRSVLHRLAVDGLVEIKRNRGAFVATPSPADTKAVFDARRVVERATTEIVTRTIMTSQVTMLKRNLSLWEREWMHGQRQKTIAGIGSFHMALASMAHNRPLAMALERLVLQTSLILALYATNTTFSSAAVEYNALLALIDDGQSLAAAKAMDRCLHVIEHELDMRPVAIRDVNLLSVFRP